MYNIQVDCDSWFLFSLRIFHQYYWIPSKVQKMWYVRLYCFSLTTAHSNQDSTNHFQVMNYLNPIKFKSTYNDWEKLHTLGWHLSKFISLNLQHSMFINSFRYIKMCFKSTYNDWGKSYLRLTPVKIHRFKLTYSLS